MSESKLTQVKSHENIPAHRFYSPSLQPLLQNLLASLVDMDFEYEREKEKLSRTLSDVNLKIKVLEKLKERHHQRRQPYIQELAVLQDRIRHAAIKD
jgi:hypothetical protein